MTVPLPARAREVPLASLEAYKRAAHALERLAAARDDESAWGDLFDVTWPYLIALSYRALEGQRDLAEEAGQETFVRIARYADFEALRRPDAFFAYSRTVCRNVVRTMWRARHRALPETADLDALRAWEREGAAVAVAPPDAFDVADVRASLARVLPRLSPDDQRLLAWLIDDYTVEDMAALAGCSRGAIRVRIHRLRNVLRHLVPDEARQAR